MVDSLDGPLNGAIVLGEVWMVGEMGGQGHLLGNLPHRETLQRNKPNIKREGYGLALFIQRTVWSWTNWMASLHVGRELRHQLAGNHIDIDHVDHIDIYLYAVRVDKTSSCPWIGRVC